MKRLFLPSFLVLALGASAQNITPDMLSSFEKDVKVEGASRAIKNALAANSVASIALNQDNQTEKDTYFSNSVPSKGITDQQSSGRCWLFTGLNVLRAKMINEQKLEGMEFSQNYLFFYDQLEKANLFLQAIIDTRQKPQDDRTVMWLFQNPLAEGHSILIDVDFRFCVHVDIYNFQIDT